MDDKAFLEFLWKHGHFWNRAYPDVLNVEQGDLPFLRLTDKAVQFAVASYQMSDANLRPLVRAYHKREPVFDGLAGPATMELATFDRCPMPDFAPPPNALFHYDDPSLQKAVESMQRRAEGATGRGSWPAGCHGTAGVHEVKISYDLSKLTTKHKEWWPEIKAASHAACAAVGILLTEVPVGQRANITVYGNVLGGNVIGMAEFNGESCGDVVFCQLNPNFAPSLDSVLKLLLHENGHNWNLEHRPGHIMNPSIMPDSLPNFWIKRGADGSVEYQDNSYPTLKSFFGGAPLTPPAPPTPPVPIPAMPYAIALGADLPAGLCTITTKGGGVVQAALSSARKAGTYLFTTVDPEPPQ